MMEKNLEVLTGFRMHYQVSGEKIADTLQNFGYIFNGHIGFAKDTRMEDAIAKVRKTIEDDGRTVVFYTVKCSNVKKFNNEI